MLPHKIYLSRAQTKSMSAYEPIGDPTGGAAYGEFNDPVTAVVSAGANLLGASMGADAAENAANTQAAASNYSAGLQKQMFDTQNAQQAPYREAGYGSLKDIAEMKPYLQHQFNAQDFQEGIDPGYAFRLKQGQEQAMRQANLGGGALSGNALAGLQDYTQGQASQEYGNAFNRYQTQRGNIYNTLASIAGLGQTSLGQTGQMSTQAGANIGQAISNAGAAQAAGQVGVANALSGGITGAANTYALSNLLRGNQMQTSMPTGYGTPVAQPFDVNIA